MTAPYVRMHDGWLMDPKVQRLLARRETDAVVLFWGLICHCHAQDSDGQMLREDVLNVARSAHLPDGNRALRVLRRAGLVANVDRSLYEVVRYGKWQTTSDQRKDNADRMRTSRARSNGRASIEREKERKNARARPHVPQADEDDADGVVRLGPESRRVLAELEGRETDG